MTRIRHSYVLAEGIVDLLESGETTRREASGSDMHKQEAALERARKAMKASRDKKTGRKAAEDALQEDASGKCASAILCITQYKLKHYDLSIPARQMMLSECAVCGVSIC